MATRRSEQVFEQRRRGARRGHAARARSGYDQRLNRLLVAATGVMARDGYRRASMRAIAHAAGVSLAGVYHYVDSKERLLFLIQFRAFSALHTEVRARLCGVEDPVEQLRVLIRTHVGYVAENMESLRVCSHELDSLTGESFEQVRRVRREYYELARAIVGRVIGECAPECGLDRRIATMSLFGTLNWLYRWYDPAGERSPASVANQIFSQFCGGIQSGAAGASGVAPGGRRRSVPARGLSCAPAGGDAHVPA